VASGFSRKIQRRMIAGYLRKCRLTELPPEGGSHELFTVTAGQVNSEASS
jgi:hypothetical protein